MRNNIEGQEYSIITFLKVVRVVTSLLCVMPSGFGILGSAQKRHCISHLGKGEA